MRSRPAIALLVGGLVLVGVSALRFRQENAAASGFGVVMSPTTLDLYGGGRADHRLSIVLVAFAVVVLAGCPSGGDVATDQGAGTEEVRAVTKRPTR